MEIKYNDTPIYEATSAITVAAADRESIILTNLDTDAQHIKITFSKALSPSLYLSHYAPKLFVKAVVKYDSEDNIADDIMFGVVNRETTEVYFELKGQDIDRIILYLINNSTSSVTYTNFKAYTSVDVSPTQIVNVLKAPTIRTDIIHAASAFFDATFTQYLETNAKSRSTRNAHPGDIVDCIRIEGMEIGFYEAVLGSETEQFSITTSISGVPHTQYYWYAIIDEDYDDAYEALTTVDPRTVYPNISDSDRNAFKFMVYKPSSENKKLSIEFAYDENHALTPTIIYGAGNQSGKQKGYTYKNSNGFYHIYEQSNGDLIGIVMDENGVHITGWADQHAESIKFYNNGVKLKFTGEEEHKFEYVIENSVLTGILEDDNFLTSITYHDEDL